MIAAILPPAASSLVDAKELVALPILSTALHGKERVLSFADARVELVAPNVAY